MHDPRTAAVERHHVDAEARLQRRESVKLIQHHVRHGVALQFDDDAVAVAVGFIAQVADALDLLFLDQLGDALDHRRLVHLVGDLGDDERLALLADGLDRDLAAHDDRAAAEMIGGADARASENDAAGREIRSRHDVDELVDGERWVVDQRDAGVDDLAEIVRRDVGRHADRDAAGAVDEKVRELGRQDRRLGLVVVVVRLEVDGILVDVGQQSQRRLRQARLGVTIGGRGIAVDRAEIALAVDQRHAHREVLRHADHGVVDRLVAVRMILTDDVTDHAGGLDVFLVGCVPLLVHRVQDAAMHRLQTVARIGQRTRHDHAHGVVEIGLLHLLEDGDGANIRGLRRLVAGLVVVSQGEIR
ncbi:hypothetical protein ACVI3S_003896 [Bradyrhizobium diazoefficiens]